jgi:hypothetical protein
MGALLLHARLNLCSGVGVATAPLYAHAMGNFAIKKAPHEAVASQGAGVQVRDLGGGACQ